MQKAQVKILISLLLASSLVAAQGDEPDTHKEERFHRIYKKYNEIPTSNEAWEKALAGRNAQTYRVQPKDTLWDLSQTLFADPNYWPKVWSLNSEEILNPHQINPDLMIKFYPGTMAEAPTVGLADKNAPPEAMPDQVIEKKADGQVDVVKIPPPKKTRPVVKVLPGSLPLYRMGGVNRPPPEIEEASLKRSFKPAEKYLSFYVVDKAIEEAGEVVEMDQGARIAGDYTYITVRLKNAAAKNFVAVSDERTVKDPFAVLNSAHIVEVQGNIEVKERVNPSGDLFRAIVTKSIQPVQVGAKLIVGSMSMFNTGESTMVNAVQARVIGGEFQTDRRNLFGTDSLIFLNAGAKEGLQQGSTMQLFYNERVRNEDTKSTINDRVVGVVKIVNSADHYSTAYVVRSENDINVGDYVGGNGTLSGSAAASASSGDDADTSDLDKELSAPEETPAAPTTEAVPSADEELQL